MIISYLANFAFKCRLTVAHFLCAVVAFWRNNMRCGLFLPLMLDKAWRRDACFQFDLKSYFNWIYKTYVKCKEKSKINLSWSINIPERVDRGWFRFWFELTRSTKMWSAATISSVEAHASIKACIEPISDGPTFGCLQKNKWSWKEEFYHGISP